MKKWLLIIICLVEANYVSYAQKGNAYQVEYGINKTQSGSTVIELPDKGFLLIGTSGYGAGGSDVLAIRTDSNCNQLWAKTYGGANNEGYYPYYYSNPVDAVITPEKDIVICTSTTSYGAGSYDIYLIKIDLKGNVKWAKTFGEYNNDYGLGVAVDSNGGYLLTGEYDRISGDPGNQIGSGDLIVIKTDTSGALIWAKTYGKDSAEEVGAKIIPARDGNYIIGGYNFTHSLTEADYNQLLMKIDDAGNMKWARCYGNGHFTMLNSILELPDWTIYTGGSYVPNPNTVGFREQQLFSKFGYNGSLQYSRTYTYGELNSLSYDAKNNKINAGCVLERYSASTLTAAYLDTNGYAYYFKEPESDQTLPLGKNFIALSTGGFACIQSNFQFLKMDNGLNSGGCNPDSIFVYTQNVGLTERTYIFKVKSVNPSIGSGISTNSFALHDSILCGPLKCKFGWAGHCSDYIQFYDSSFYNAGSWQWNFGDPASQNNLAYTKNPVHIFSKQGTYTVKLIVKNGEATDSVKKTITVLQSPAIAPFTIKQGHDTDTFVPIDTSIGSFTWHFGIYGDSSIKKQPIFIYPDDLYNYVVELVVRGSNGCNGYRTDTVPGRITCRFNYGGLCAGDSTTFHDLSIYKPNKWKWNFGDNGSATNISTIENPNHFYLKPGSYLVKLIVSNNVSTDSFQTWVTISPSKTIAKWSIVQNQDTVQFIPADTTLGIYTWHFGDHNNDISTKTKPVFIYPGQGTYIVKLDISNYLQCYSERADTLIIGGSGIDEQSVKDLNIKVFPNPVDGLIRISYNLKSESRIDISVYNLTGRKVAVLKNGIYGSEKYADVYDLLKSKFPDGIYVLKLSINDRVYTKKIEILNK